MSNTNPSTEAGSADNAPTGIAPDAGPDLKTQADKLVVEGKKAIALREWEEGVGKYAEALDHMRRLVGDFDPAMAPLLLSYGKALYELAFSQQGVMGKDEVDKQAGGVGEESEGVAGSSSNFVFSADPTSDDEEGGQEEGGQTGETSMVSDAAGENTEIVARGETGQEGENGEDVDEPEDDYNAAWEVLDVARTIYSKIVEDLKEGEGKEERLLLAECFLALGDVSLETENFPQAVQDYTSALGIKDKLLPPSSRALASVHYQLATVLEFTPNGRSDALSHVEAALTGFKARLTELCQSSKTNISEEVGKMSGKEMENERKDVEGLIGDLEVKIEELKASPPAGDIVSESINHLLGQVGEASGLGGGGGGAGAGSVETGPVNDLTSMVKKKKKPAAAPSKADGKGKGIEGQQNGASNGEKRKVEGAEDGTEAKRAKGE